MTIVVHEDVIQGSEEWAAMRCGLLTASEMHFLVTPTLKIASNDKELAHLYELLGQRITQYVEPQYISDDMLRGMGDEIDAVADYKKKYAPVKNVGFITNDKWGFTLGYSPDGLVGDDGLIECKSRRQKLQVKTLIEYVSIDGIDPNFMIQAQTGLMVSERKWCDHLSRCGGLPMSTVRVYPMEEVQTAILTAATAFEARMAVARKKYDDVLSSKARLIPTERKIEVEMFHSGMLNNDELKGGIPL